MTTSDRLLLRRIPGDPAALDALYRRHVGTVTRFAARRTTRPEDLADVVAEVFVRAMESARSFDGRNDSALPWLLGITANTVRDQRRTHRRAAGVVVKLGCRGDLPDEEYALLEERIDAERVAPALLGALDRLSPDDRALVELVALDGLPVQDAARVLRIRPAAARMRLSRIRRRLRGQLAQGEPDGPVPQVPRVQGEPQ